MIKEFNGGKLIEFSVGMARVYYSPQTGETYTFSMADESVQMFQSMEMVRIGYILYKLGVIGPTRW